MSETDKLRRTCEVQALAVRKALLAQAKKARQPLQFGLTLLVLESATGKICYQSALKPEGLAVVLRGLANELDPPSSSSSASLADAVAASAVGDAPAGMISSDVPQAP